MKRAAFLCIATAIWLFLGLSSAPLQADTQNIGKSGNVSIVAPGTGPQTPNRGVGDGNGGGGGGTDEGDADGLSGLKNRPPLGADSRENGTTTIFWELWWKFMILWAR
jgi:hypothetical protein